MSRSVSGLQGSACQTVCSPTLRAAKALRLGERAGPNPLHGADNLTGEQSEVPPAPRSQESIRAENAAARLAASRDLRPLAKARHDFAEAFDAVLHKHQVRGEEAYSNVAIARACGVDESIVRAWRNTKETQTPKPRPIPAAALRLLPSEIYNEMLGYLASVRDGRIQKRALPRLRPVLTELEGQMAHEDRDVVVRELVGAQVQIADLMKKAMGER